MQSFTVHDCDWTHPLSLYLFMANENPHRRVLGPTVLRSFMLSHHVPLTAAMTTT